MAYKEVNKSAKRRNEHVFTEYYEESIRRSTQREERIRRSGNEQDKAGI